MSLPEFSEIPAPADCPCPGCAEAAAQDRAAVARSTRVRATRLVAAGAMTAAAFAGAGTAGTTEAVAAEGATPSSPVGTPMGDDDGSPSPQGMPSPSTGSAATAAPRLTRAQILARAQGWIDAKVPYSMNRYRQGYRTDCSGFVSMAWSLPGSHWTGDLHQYATRITKTELRPGDMLLFHNTANPQRGSHVVLFGGWADGEHTRYVVLEQAGGRGAVKRTIPYAYTSHGSSYIPYRYNGVQEEDAPGDGSDRAFPGAARFGPGADNADVTRLGTMLIGRGAGRFYQHGPGPRWGRPDSDATRAFQQAQGWSGAAADGIPGAQTWRLLVEGRGKDIGPGADRPADHPANRPPAFPGAGHFRPGQRNDHVALLGRQLVAKGYGRYYRQGPGPAWSESDRRAVQAFQADQGWHGADADGYPGEHTWRLLFR
ncbi:peptidoglycan-binding protein [Kitasatospora sp. NPDC057904]|uniref:peptidoglycan-binding protein n=1 Tax=Kitasatospora sp. NPDC057904 TaxID=3346275 RepID=UPI0036D919A9